MAEEDKYKKKNGLIDDETGDAGKGGKGGQIEFKDFLAEGHSRDDLLSETEKRRLLSVHHDTHELLVKKQKELIAQRKALKAGKIPLPAYHQGLGAAMGSQYKANPVLADKAQFSGIDRQVNQLPNDYIADTNQANRDDLQLRYAPQNAPRFNPKPHFNR